MATPWYPHVVAIEMVSSLNGTPASVRPSDGTMLIDATWWNNAPFYERLFVLLHEVGHLESQNRSEFDADRWAFDVYAREGHSPRAAIDAIRHFLPFRTPEHYERATALLNQALAFDQSPKG